MGFVYFNGKARLSPMRACFTALSGLFILMMGCSGNQSERPPVNNTALSTASPPASSPKNPSPNSANTVGKTADTSAPATTPQAQPGMLTRAQAEKYMLDLVNRDRKAHGLNPVVWNATAAKAGQRQAEDMAKHGFTAHFGTDGSYPEQRHTEAGGVAMVTENVACFADAKDRELDPDPLFPVEELDRIERTFMDEVPPMDGHRRNILTAQHTSLGVGLSKTKELHIVCLAQEFIDDYGKYEPVPKKAALGANIRVAGEVVGNAQIAAVGLARVDLPKARTAADLNKTYAYAMPQPYVTYFPKGFKSPIPLNVNGNSFWIEVPLSDRNKPGLYSLSVWGRFSHTKDLLMISLQTIEVK